MRDSGTFTLHVAERIKEKKVTFPQKNMELSKSKRETTGNFKF